MGRSLPLVYRRGVAAYSYGTVDVERLCCMNMGSRGPQTYFPRGTASFSRSSSHPSPDLSGCHTAIHRGARVLRHPIYVRRWDGKWERDMERKWDLAREWERDDYSN